MHSNHFDDLDHKASLMASVAHIPWMGRYFVGFLVGFWLEGDLYQFTTYNGAKLTSSIVDDQVILVLTRRDTRLELTATKAETAELISPLEGEMRGKVNESLSAQIHVRLTKQNEVLFEGDGRHSGLEVAGDISILLTE
jgi:hypothetical protein